MCLAIVKPNLQVHNRVTGNRTTVQGFHKTFFHGGYKIPGNVHAAQILHELKAGVQFQRSDIEMDFRKLPPAARLFFVTVNDPFDRFFDRFPVRYFHRIQVHFHTKFSIQLFACNLQMDLPRTGQDDFPCGLIPGQFECWILFEKLGKRTEDFVLTPFDLCLHCVRYNRGQSFGGFVDDGITGRTKRIPGDGFFELGYGNNISGAGRFNGLLFFSFKDQELADFFLNVFGGVIYGGI